MESTAGGTVAVGVGLGRTVGVLVGCGEGEAVGDVVAVASGVAAPPQPPIARAVRRIKAVPRSEPIVCKPFSVG